MNGSGELQKQLRDALASAFPTRMAFQMFLAEELGQNLDAIAGPGALNAVIFQVIQEAFSAGWEERLVAQAMERQPGNLMLLAFHRDVWLKRVRP